jgi:hypothetical protein
MRKQDSKLYSFRYRHYADEYRIVICAKNDEKALKKFYRYVRRTHKSVYAIVSIIDIDRFHVK